MQQNIAALSLGWAFSVHPFSGTFRCTMDNWTFTVAPCTIGHKPLHLGQLDIYCCTMHKWTLHHCTIAPLHLVQLDIYHCTLYNLTYTIAPWTIGHKPLHHAHMDINRYTLDNWTYTVAPWTIGHIPLDLKCTSAVNIEKLKNELCS